MSAQKKKKKNFKVCQQDHISLKFYFLYILLASFKEILLCKLIVYELVGAAIFQIHQWHLKTFGVESGISAQTREI